MSTLLSLGLVVNNLHPESLRGHMKQSGGGGGGAGAVQTWRDAEAYQHVGHAICHVPTC